MTLQQHKLEVMLTKGYTVELTRWNETGGEKFLFEACLEAEASQREWRRRLNSLSDSKQEDIAEKYYRGVKRNRSVNYE